VPVWLRRYPTDVEPVLARVAAIEEGRRLELLGRAIAATTGDARTRLLDALRTEARCPSPRRVSACAMLRDFGDPSGYRDRVREWRTAGTPTLDWVADLADLLAAGGVEAWVAIRSRLEHPAERTALANALAELRREELLEHVPPEERAAWHDAVRACLEPLLADTTAIGPRTVAHARGTVSLHCATIADVAACTLASLAPERFRFDPVAIGRVRVAQLRSLLGTPSPVAALRRPTAAPDEIVAVHLDESAARLAPATRVLLAACDGRVPDAQGLMEALLALLRDPAAKGHRAVLELERAGRDSGTVLRFALEATGVTDAVRMLCTVGGAVIARRHLGAGGLNDLATLREHGILLGIEQALSAPPSAPVEITVGLARDD
jgi:hypothetical protein